MPAGRRVDELGGDPDPSARFAHAPLEDVAHAEALTDLAEVDVLALEGEGGIAGDHEKPRKLRERGDDVLRDAVGEIFLLRVAAHVVERQHGDRGRRASGERGAGFSTPDGSLASPAREARLASEYAHRLGNILELGRAEITDLKSSRALTCR